MTRADPNIHVKSKPPENVITMIVPGRRALGETWRHVTISATPDKIVVQNDDLHDHGLSAPATGQPLMAIGAKEREYADEIIQALHAKAEQKAKNPQDMSPQERWEAVNEAWQNYVEQKLRWYEGRSQFGPTGFTQRQKVHR